MKQALTSYRRAIEINSDYAEAYFNLGTALSEQGQLESAIFNYLRAIELQPDNSNAYNNLGFALFKQARLEEAVANYQRAIEYNPKNVVAYNNLANALKKQGHNDQAIENYRHAIALDASYSDAYENLAHALRSKGNLPEAITVYRQWLEHDPDNSIAQHMLAACTGMEIPKRASDSYVRNTFDFFASGFDETLHAIGYCGPALINKGIEESLLAPRGELVVLDAGCGTGLCGQGVRPYALRLVGVDLSPGMLAKAAERGLYDDLITAELTDYLKGIVDTYDLIVSADTLIYFGALDDLIAGTARALRANGRYVFTVERAYVEDTPTGFLLNPHGRYSHTEEYIRRMAANADLSVEIVSEETIRMELGKPVAGLLVVARKTDSDGR